MIPENISDYDKFLIQKTHVGANHGFDPVFMPNCFFDFQHHLTAWAIRKGRAAIFADCGLGKTLMELVWAENIVRKTNKSVLLLTPLAVSAQTIREGEKFGIECFRSTDGGTGAAGIYVSNYERLHLFAHDDFSGVVCDESSILKSFDGSRRKEITEFMKKVPYRLLCTATAAPNDYIELGTSSEALGYLGHMDMLNRFFKNDRNNSATRRMYGEAAQWRFKGHAEVPFWRWTTSWARAIRKPSDLGFNDNDFILPPLSENEHIVSNPQLLNGMLFPVIAVTLQEQRQERKRSIVDRCERVAGIVSDTGKPALIWCHLNAEGDLLEDMIPDAIQVSGKNKDQVKEDRFMSFIDGEARVLITKPKIGAWGLNFQHCAHVVSFPSHSYEQYYQAVRRCWRFGQENPVDVDIVMTEGERAVMSNLRRKADDATKMFESMVREMNHSMTVHKTNAANQRERMPSWL